MTLRQALNNLLDANIWVVLGFIAFFLIMYAWQVSRNENRDHDHQ